MVASQPFGRVRRVRDFIANLILVAGRGFFSCSGRGSFDRKSWQCVTKSTTEGCVQIKVYQPITEDLAKSFAKEAIETAKQNGLQHFYADVRIADTGRSCGADETNIFFWCLCREDLLRALALRCVTSLRQRTSDRHNSGFRKIEELA